MDLCFYFCAVAAPGQTLGAGQ